MLEQQSNNSIEGGLVTKTSSSINNLIKTKHKFLILFY